MGIFFNNYESAGVGISKHAPKKTGVKLFFDILGRKFWKLIEVNLLYSLFFLPLILSWTAFVNISTTSTAVVVSLLLLLIFALIIGPATAGMTKVIRKYVLEKHSFIFADFFSGFKQNFKIASLVGFVDCLIIVSIYAGLQVYPALAQQFNTKLMYVPMVLSMSLAIVILLMNFYIFLMIIATDLSFKNLIKNSFALAFVEMKKSIITFVIVILLLLAAISLPLFVSYTLIFVLPFFPAAIICLVICFNSYPVIQKYVINPYYTSIGQVNPELCESDPDDDEEPIFEDMGGKEKPIEKRKKGKGKRIS